MNIAVIGLGKLGAPWAAVLAAAGHQVVGLDVNAAAVEAVNAGRPPVTETGLAALMAEIRERFTATTDAAEACARAEATFLVLPTPTETGGGFSLKFVLQALEALGRQLRGGKSYHLVVVTSTVMPGDMEGAIRPALEAYTGRKVGEDLGLCYNPEFIALGSVIRDMRRPDFVLIGESDRRAGERLEQIHRSVVGETTVVARMSFVNAEITKLAINTFVTTKISYANMLARVCERLPGADADVVTTAIGMDTRIGRKYLKGAVSYGGPCFPRDNLAFAALGRRLGVATALPEATDCTNREQIAVLARLVQANLPPGGKVGILGLSYKPETAVCEASFGTGLARHLAESGTPVVAYDPAATAEARQTLGGGIRFASGAAECCRESDVVVIAVAWEEFRRLDPDVWRRRGKRATVIDCWRLLDGRPVEATVIPLGMGPHAG